MDENKDEQNRVQSGTEQKLQKPKKNRRKVMDIIAFIGLGVMVACVVALLVLTYCL